MRRCCLSRMHLWRRCFVILLLLWVSMPCWAAPRALVFISELCVPDEAYTKLIRALRVATLPGVKLFVAMRSLRCTEERRKGRVNAEAAGHEAVALIESGWDELLSIGFPADKTYGRTLFVGGHGLGGAAVLQASVSKTLRDHLAGVILLGSFIPRGNAPLLNDAPAVLTITGSLDGISRVTRAMEASFSYNSSAYPLVIIEGMNHFQMLDTKSAVRPGSDLEADVNDDSARSFIGTTLDLFIRSYAPFSPADTLTSLHTLSSINQQSIHFLGPLYDAFTLEGYYFFERPCMSTAEHRNCQIGSRWTEEAQSVLLSNPNISLSVSDLFFSLTRIIPDPLPSVEGRCVIADTSCHLNVTTVSDNAYEDDSIGFLDPGTTYSSASEMAVKLRSRQTILLAAGLPAFNFSVEDGPWCARINEAAMLWAETHASEKAYSRYKHRGVPLRFVDDFDCNRLFPLWFKKHVSCNLASDGRAMEVQSVSFTTSADFVIPILRGMHFCKLMSPARAMEYLYIDSLRSNSANDPGVSSL